MTQLTAISLEQFANKAWKRVTNYAFAAQVNIVQIVAIELPNLIPIMPLGFVQTGSIFELVAITSLQPGANLYVAPDGRWLGSYIPAALRGYPFRMAKPLDTEGSVLCIDEGSGLVVEAGQGEAFFDDIGAPTQATKDTLDFLVQVERSGLVTQAAVDALQAAELIQPWPINLQNGDQAVAVEGLFRINEVALNVLPDEDFLMLRKAGALLVAYAQMLSMNQLGELEKLNKLQERLKEQAAVQMIVPSGLEGFNLCQDDGTIKFAY